MPVTNNELTPLQQEVVDLYGKKCQKEIELRSLISQKKRDIALSKQKTVEKLNEVSEAISTSQASIMESFSAKVKEINSIYFDLETSLMAMQIEGGQNDE